LGQSENIRFEMVGWEGDQSDLRDVLCQQGAAERVAVECRGAFRGIESTVVVAVVSAAGGALVAFVGGILRLAEERGKQMIVIKSNADGVEVNVPVGMPLDRLDELLARVQRMQAAKIRAR